MPVLRLVAAVSALVGLGLQSWLVIQLWRWTRLPQRGPMSRTRQRLPRPEAGWVIVGLWACGGFFTAGYGAVVAALPLPGLTEHPWQYLPYLVLFPLGFAWLLYHAAKGELLHLHAYTATRNLLSTVERIVGRHGGDAEQVRRLSEVLLGDPPPDERAQPWHGSRTDWRGHGSPPAWMPGLLGLIPHDESPDDFLATAERARLSRGLRRYQQALTRFNGYRR